MYKTFLMYSYKISCLFFIGFLSKTYLSCDIEGECHIPFIKNGNYTTITYSLKPFIVFHCDKNYTLYGQAKNQCQCRRWVHPFPVCHKQFHIIPECSAPYIQKGWVECLTVGCNRFYVGTEAAIRCERGYQLVGNSRLQCRLESEPMWRKAKWSSPVPKCVLIDGDYTEINQEGTSLNIFYTENSSIMVIIIILSVLACGLMLLISAMLMNRLMKRRRLLRFPRTDNSFTNNRPAPSAPIQSDYNHESTATEQNVLSHQRRRWNCFRRRGLQYQHMETHATDNITTVDQEVTLADTSESYSHTTYSDDRESLINPPCYEEAIKCSQYSIVLPTHPNGALHAKGSKKSKRGASKASKRDKLKHMPIRPAISSVNAEISAESQQPSNVSSQSNDVVAPNINDCNTSFPSTFGPRSNDVDNVSRRSTRVHYSRVVNNISAESNNSFLSGSIETMAVSDGTSVTVHTFDSTGSNPSIGSMRPQTGSIGDPINFVNSRQPTSRFTTNNCRSNDSDFPDIDSGQRYSPPPSYESSINHPMTMKPRRSCRSNTASPSTSSNMALFVDNMACIDDNSDDITG